MVRAKSDILQKYFDTTDPQAAWRAYIKEIVHGPDPPFEAWTKIALPYIAPGVVDLPTAEEIEIGVNTNRVSHRSSPAQVCRVRNYAVKRGYGGMMLHVRITDSLYTGH